MTGDFYQLKQGWLHGLDPRSSLLLSFILMISLFFIPGLPAMGCAFVAIHLLLLSGGISLKKSFHLWSLLIPLMLLIIILWPLFNKNGQNILWRWKFITITSESLYAGALTALRLPILLLVGYIPLLTHRQNRLIRAWVALGVPYRIGLVLMLSLRFLPFFRESYHQIEQAQQMRGLKISKASIKGRLPIFVALIVWALRTSENISMALETRGLGYSQKPTFLTELNFRIRDWIVLLLSLCGLGILLYRQ